MRLRIQGKAQIHYTGINQGNNAEFKKEVEKVKDIIADAMKQVKDITTDAGKEAVLNEIKNGLKKAGYTLASSTITVGNLFDATGAFNPKALGDPTDVAALLWRKRDEFMKEKASELSKINTWLTIGCDYATAYNRLKESLNQAIEDYLTNEIKYYDPTTDIKTKLVFPDIKFEFHMRNDYWIEWVKPKQ